MISVSTAAELKQALETTGEVQIQVTQSIDITAGDINTFPVANGLNATVTINDGVTITGSHRIFDVIDASLTLNGNGTIMITTKNSYSGISVEGANAVLTIDGITIDAFTTNGKANNYAYCIYARGGATVNFISGMAKVGYGSCISTNNTTGGGTINISGGQLLADGSYAIYNAAYAVYNITGGVIQGINARMGVFNISGNTQIIGTTLTSADYDDIGVNINTSGCIWFGDTIALIMGTYTDPNGTDAVLNIGPNVTVTSNFRAAIGTYLVDTKSPSEITMKITNPANITTNDPGFEAIKTYDHEYIAAAAAAAGKSFAPVVDSEVEVVDVPESAADLKAIADEVNANSQTQTGGDQVDAIVEGIVNAAKKIAQIGGYETIIFFNSSDIPWNAQYKNEVTAALRDIGFSSGYMYYANKLDSACGIIVKWK